MKANNNNRLIQRIGNERFFKRVTLSLTAFVYSLLTLQLAQAEDIDIYTKAINSGKGGDPVVMLLLDSSGSMEWSMYSSSSSDAYPLKNRRETHLRDAARGLLTSVAGNVSVGLANYSGSKVQVEAQRVYNILGTSSVGAGAIDVQISSSADDVNQSDISNGSTMTTTGVLNFGKVLVSGGGGGGSATYNVKVSATRDDATCELPTGTCTNSWQGFYVVRNNGNSKYTKSGALFRGLDSIPVGATITNAYVRMRGRSGGFGSNAHSYIYYETSANPSNYQSSTVKSRSLSAVREDKYWPNEGSIYNEYEYADVTSIVSDWMTAYHAGGSSVINIIFQGYQGTGGNFRSRNNTSNSQPRLYVDYDTVASPAVTAANNVGLRFRQLTIPAGATVSNAVLELESNTNENEDFSLSISVDQADDPLEFNSIDHLGAASRTWSTPLIVSDDEDWNAPNKYTVDITSLIANKVASPNWSCGKDIVIRISDSGLLDGYRVADSWDTEIVNNPPDGVPKLQVTLGGGGDQCKTLARSLMTSSEDAEQFASDNNEVTTDEEEINVGSTDPVMLRFTNIEFHQNGSPVLFDSDNVHTTNFGSANIELIAANTTASPGTFTITVEDHPFSFPFTSEAFNITQRPRTLGSVEWTPTEWVQNRTYTSPNLSSIIQPLIDNTIWEYSGTIGIIIEGDGGDAEAKAWDYEDNSGNNWGDYGNYAPVLRLTASVDTSDDYYTQREQLIDWIDAFTVGGGTPLIDSYADVSRYMLDTGGGGDSPIDPDASCASNNIVLLTDGDPSGDSEDDANDISGYAGPSCGQSEASCLFDAAHKLSEYLSTDGQGEGYNVDTHTILFGPGVNATVAQLYKDVSTVYGNGIHKSAQDSGDLADAFKTILGSISDSGASISVPGVAVSAFNRITLLDEVYYSLFKPSTKVGWVGNLKRYSLQSDTIVDVNGDDAIDGDTTYFTADAQSWWSADPDGPQVAPGGAATLLDPTTRNIQTYLGAYGHTLNADLKDEAVNRDNDNITDIHLGLDRLSDYAALSGSEKDALRLNVLDWAAGGTALAPRNAMGDSIHSSPVMIGYNENSGDLVSTLFVGSNEGYMHAFNSGEPTERNAALDLANTGGNELFAFMPRETLANAGILQSNPVDINNKVYGLDLTWEYWREGGDNTAIEAGAVTDTNHVYVYGGMRRGGRMMYGLDVTSVYQGGAIEPKILFAIGNPEADMVDGSHGPQFVDTLAGTPDDIEGSSPYNTIGQTWSVPRVRTLLWGDTPTTVILFGGGYDPRHDDPNYESSGTLFGNRVYMADATTGKLLWVSDPLPASVVARISPYDRTGDVYMDSFYAVDLEGNVLRFDLNDDGDDFNQHTIAQLGGSGADNRKFYDEPSVAPMQNVLTGQIDFMIAVGSGYRAQPEDETVNEAMFLIYDRGAFTTTPTAPDAVIEYDMLIETNPTTGVSEDPSDEDGIYQMAGWYYDFEALGEKAVGDPIIFNNLLLFTAYINPDIVTTITCTPVLGETRIYVMDVFGKGRADIFGGDAGDAFLEITSAGMAPALQVVTIDGKPGLLNDKRVITPPDDSSACELIDCTGREIERSYWKSEAGGL